MALFDTCAHARVCAFYIACGVGIHFAGNDFGDLGHGDVVRHKLGRGHFNNRLRGGDPSYRCPCHTCIEKPRDEFIGKKAKLLGRNWPGNDHIGHSVAPRPPANLRFIGLFGQRGDGIDRRLNFVRGAAHVPAGLELKRDAGAIFAAGGAAAFDAFHGKKRGLQYLDNGSIHIFGACPVPDDRNTHAVDDHVGEKLRSHLGGGSKAQYDQHHQ